MRGKLFRGTVGGAEVGVSADLGSGATMLRLGCEAAALRSKSIKERLVFRKQAKGGKWKGGKQACGETNLRR